jgi:hypothetical protein
MTTNIINPAAGVFPAASASQIAAAETPATVPAATSLSQLTAPINKAEWAFALLVGLGINPVTHPNSVIDLIAQQNVEGTTGNLWNNPLASSQRLPGSTTKNSDGVQAYAKWQDGVTGSDTLLLASRNSAALTALQNNASLSDYGKALESSDWEGLGGSSYAPNVSYGEAVGSNGAKGGGSLSAAYTAFDPTGILGQIETGVVAGVLGPGGVAITDAAGVTNIDPWTSAEGGAAILKWLGIPSINWKVIGWFTIAVSMILIGIYILFHNEIDSTVGAVAKVAPAAAV